jgi:hypothetical protein
MSSALTASAPRAPPPIAAMTIQKLNTVKRIEPNPQVRHAHSPRRATMALKTLADREETRRGAD